MKHPVIPAACLGAVLLGLSALHSTAQTALPAFRPTRGIGIYRPFNQLADRPGADGTLFLRPWRCFFQPSDFVRLKQAGFDTIRVFVEPEIFWRLEAAGRKASLESIGGFVRTANASGLKVIVVLMATPGRPRDPKILTQSPANDTFKDYRAAVTAMAGYFSGFDPRNVALELFNEPPGPCQWTDRPDWPVFQELIYRDARQAAPRLSLVLTGACASAAEGFQYLPTDADYVKDPNTFFTEHYYDPYDFTLQGQGPRRKYLTGMPWPADPATRPAVETAVRGRIENAADLGPVDKMTTERTALGAVAQYYQAGYDATYIDRKLGLIETWRRKAGVPAGRILVGEFGATRKYGSAGEDAAAPADRLRWYTMVRAAAEKLGYPWLMWSYYGNMSVFGDDPPSWQIPPRHFDPGMIQALGLSPHANDPVPGEDKREICPAR